MTFVFSKENIRDRIYHHLDEQMLGRRILCKALISKSKGYNPKMLCIRRKLDPKNPYLDIAFLIRACEVIDLPVEKLFEKVEK